MPTLQIDFQPFAASSGANVETQSAYIADSTTLANGFSTGVAPSAKLNKVWRQSSIMSAVLATYISQTLNVNTIDDGTTATLLTNLAQANRLDSFAVDTSSTANTLTITLPISPGSFIEGETIVVKPANTNTGPSTINVNGLGALAIYTASGALSGGELTAGSYYELAYNSSLNKWILMNSATSAITQPNSDNSTKIATTAFVKNQAYAPLTSPTLAGVPTAPTPATSDSSATVATTAFVKNAIASGAGLLPSGTTVAFYQAAAPTGWTQITSLNNFMMTITSGAGGSYGGNMSPINMTSSQVPNHTHTFTSGVESATHTHHDSGHQHTFAGAYANSMGSGNAWPGADTNATGTTNVGYANLGTETAQHTHSGTTDSNGGVTAWTPQYATFILCSKN